MGMSIDLHIYDYFDLIKEITELVEEEPDRVPEGHTINDFVERVMPKFGIRAGDKWVTLWNEYYSDSGYNSASEFFRAVELYFGLDDVFLSGYGYGEHNNAEEVLDDLGIDYVERDDY
jgi:hypothetical protein